MMTLSYVADIQSYMLNSFKYDHNNQNGDAQYAERVSLATTRTLRRHLNMKTT